MKITQGKLDEILARPGYKVRVAAGAGAGEESSPTLQAVVAKASAASKDPRARMNKTEARYLDERIMPMVAAGEVVRWRFDEVRFCLGPQCWYKPDFYLVFADGHIEIHETKGGWIEEDGRIKFKATAAKFPEYTWDLWQWKGGKWSRLMRV